MEVYDDLTLYSYSHFEYALNVGWVELDEQISELYDSSELLKHLILYLDRPFNTVRENANILKWKYNDKEYLLGFSEIRVISKSGIVYAAPNTILYSINMQGYCPPTSFVDAVLDGISPDSAEYQFYIKRYNAKDFWGATEEQKELSQKVEKSLELNDLASLAGMVKNDPSVLNAVTNNGSILNKAIIVGNEKLALWLLDNAFPIQNYGGLELLTAIEKKMDTVAEKLIDSNIPMPVYSLKKNPLFVAIAYRSNAIAMRLFLERSELRQKYSNEFVRNCDLLQWSASCDNAEMLSFIRNNL